MRTFRLVYGWTFNFGLTAVGHATIATLALNRDRVINIREADKAVGRHPPAEDPIQAGANEGR